MTETEKKRKLFNVYVYKSSDWNFQGEKRIEPIEVRTLFERCSLLKAQYSSSLFSLLSLFLSYLSA